MKRPAIFIFIALLVAFGFFAVAQNDQITPSRRQNNGMQGQGGGMQHSRKMRDSDMMDRSNVNDCTIYIVNRVLMGSSNFFLDMSEQLRLTDAQIDELQLIRLNHVKQTIDLQGELYIAQIKMQDLLESDVIGINDANRKISDSYDLEAELQIKRVKSMIDARNVLTPSQREQIKSLTRRDMMLPVTGNNQGQRR